MSDYGRLMEEVAQARRYLAALDGVLAALTVEAGVLAALTVAALTVEAPEPCPPDPMNAPEPAV